MIISVGNFIKRWLSEHFQDFRGNEMLIDRMTAMCKQNFLVNEKSLGEKILSTLEEQRQVAFLLPLLGGYCGSFYSYDIYRNWAMAKALLRPRLLAPNSPPPSFPSPLTLMTLTLSRLLANSASTNKAFIGSDDLCCSVFRARVLTFISTRQIHPKECLDQCWSKKDKYTRAPNVMGLIDLFNHCASWVSSTIIGQSKLEDRVREIKRFMRVAIELRRLNNFNGCQEILAGLSDSSIYRLRASWLKVERDDKLMQEFDEVKKALSPDKSWVTYRAILKEIQPPCIPYLGVYLTDLTFIEDGNSNYLQTTDSRTDIINFEKCRKQALVIGNILLYQQDSYNFERVDVIFDMFFKGLKFIEDKDALHKMSRTIEPSEMVEEAKRKAAKKAERDAAKKKSDAAGTPVSPSQTLKKSSSTSGGTPRSSSSSASPSLSSGSPAAKRF